MRYNGSIKARIMEDNRLNLAGKKVVVGLTGRTDSALAAFLLKKQGMKLLGSLLSPPTKKRWIKEACLNAIFRT